MAFTSAAVHAMVMAGCFGDQGCLWVAVCYLGVLADITATHDYGWATEYDRVIRSKGEQDPTFKAANALPFYREMHMEIMLELKLRVTPPSHVSSSHPPATAAASSPQ